MAFSTVPCAKEEIPHFTEKIRTLIILKSNSSEKLSVTLVTAVSNKLSYKQTRISSRHMTLREIEFQVRVRRENLADSDCFIESLPSRRRNCKVPHINDTSNTQWLFEVPKNSQ